MTDKYKATELSTCCGAAMTFSDYVLVCKSCYEEQPLEVLV